MKTVEYLIICQDDPARTANEVTRYLKAGWKLAGGLVVGDLPYRVYAQAIVREEEIENAIKHGTSE